MTKLDKWERYCALTCLGGSEERGCLCESPKDCELQFEPDFVAERKKSGERMMRFLLGARTVGQS